MTVALRVIRYLFDLFLRYVVPIQGNQGVEMPILGKLPKKHLEFFLVLGSFRFYFRDAEFSQDLFPGEVSANACDERVNGYAMLVMACVTHGYYVPLINVDCGGV